MLLGLLGVVLFIASNLCVQAGEGSNSGLFSN